MKLVKEGRRRDQIQNASAGHFEVRRPQIRFKRYKGRSEDAAHRSTRIDEIVDIEVGDSVRPPARTVEVEPSKACLQGADQGNVIDRRLLDHAGHTADRRWRGEIGDEPFSRNARTVVGLVDRNRGKSMIGRLFSPEQHRMVRCRNAVAIDQHRSRV